MKKEISTSQVNADVPAVLADRLDEFVDRLGWAKKRIVAAAIMAFLDSTEDEQFEMYREVYKRFYAGPLSPRDAREAAQDAKVDEILADDLKGKSKTKKGA